jgi:hypothetical protein
MRVFGASVHSEPIVPNLGHPQGTEIPTDERASRRERVVLEASFNNLKAFSWVQLADAIR